MQRHGVNPHLHLTSVTMRGMEYVITSLGEPVTILDTDDDGECDTCRREVATIETVERGTYNKVYVCRDCLLKALTP